MVPVAEACAVPVSTHVFGLLDALMVVLGKHPDKSQSMLLQAFSSRFASGFLAANVALRIHPISGALVGLLIGLPDAFTMKSCDLRGACGLGGQNGVELDSLQPRVLRLCLLQDG
jgi:hypothetical protein